MKPLAAVTPIEIERIQVELLRGLSPAERFARMCDMVKCANDMHASVIQWQHPEESPENIRMRVIARRLPRDVMVKVYGWDPASHAA